eukprot:6189339-Pleurochrysis_carterae.AAC.2
MAFIAEMAAGCCSQWSRLSSKRVCAGDSGPLDVSFRLAKKAAWAPAMAMLRQSTHQVTPGGCKAALEHTLRSLHGGQGANAINMRSSP